MVSKYKREKIKYLACCNGILYKENDGSNKGDRSEGRKRGYNFFHSCFSPKNSTESVMDVGTDIIDMVKTNKKGLCKDTIENLTKDWPGGSYLVLRRKSMLTWDRALIVIGYNYYAQKVLSLIFYRGYMDQKFRYGLFI